MSVGLVVPAVLAVLVARTAVVGLVSKAGQERRDYTVYSHDKEVRERES